MVATLKRNVFNVENVLDTTVQNQRHFIPDQCEELKKQCEEIDKQIASIEKTISQQFNIVHNYANRDLRYDASTGKSEVLFFFLIEKL